MTGSPAFDLWVYLAASPLLWLTLTIGVFLAAQYLARLSGFHTLVNPVLITIVLIVLVLQLTGTSYNTYFDGAQFIHFILGPATVALAVPLYRSRKLVRASALPILAALAVGAPFAMLSATGIALLLGAAQQIVLALVPKSVTAGIAVGIAGEIGGEPALTAVLVISTGILGAIIVTPLMNALRITDYAARGFAAGLTSHGIGTARAFQVNSVAGTFAGLAMALNGLATAFLAPLIFRTLFGA
ncbi:LrgB family protein [Devosia lacusdianchii]|jgi:predicted murein hydrolase (TIGR00659 family)|uniref:LrgB family protein n=1 Tax=Devosia lacusdianchii TaxID=2917991 RepID=UPI001F06377D|nr:LrgB family protein [Devosia sp. JXJ CY 41]